MPTLSAQTSPDQPPDEGQTPDTSSMVHMAYGPSGAPMAAPPPDSEDDLSALRQRLMDRPLQAPELGQVKPASSSGGSRDGWIRF
jgi:hypothetical protein